MGLGPEFDDRRERVNWALGQQEWQSSAEDVRATCLVNNALEQGGTTDYGPGHGLSKHPVLAYQSTS